MNPLAMFFANRIILGKQTFESVPAKLKDQVRELLVDAGVGHLCDEETGEDETVVSEV